MDLSPLFAVIENYKDHDTEMPLSGVEVPELHDLRLEGLLCADSEELVSYALQVLYRCQARVNRMKLEILRRNESACLSLHGSSDTLVAGASDVSDVSSLSSSQTLPGFSALSIE